MRILTAAPFEAMLRQALADDFLSANEEADLSEAAESSEFVPRTALGPLAVAIERYEDRGPALDEEAARLGLARECLTTQDVATCVAAGPPATWGAAGLEAVTARAFELRLQAGRAVSTADALQRVYERSVPRQAVVHAESIVLSLNRRVEVLEQGRTPRAASLLDDAVAALYQGMALGRPFYNALAERPSVGLLLEAALTGDSLDRYHDFVDQNVAER